MSDYEIKQKIRNVTVGIFVIVGFGALAWLIFKFGDLPIAVSRLSSFKVFVQFASAPGVQVDTPINFCGYQIGRVTDIFPPQLRTDQVTNQRYHQIVTVLSIDNKYKSIPSNVNVKLMTRGLGSSYIELSVDPSLPVVPRDPNEPKSAFLMDGMQLQGSTGVTSEFFPEESQKKLDELIEGLSRLIKNANSIIGDPNNKQNFSATLDNLSDTTAQATETLKQLESFFAAGTETTGELNKVIAKLSVIFDKINSGDGTAGRFVNDAQFYESLLENSEQLQILLKEFRDFISKLNEKGVKVKL